jgi:hypothetical protein
VSYEIYYKTKLLGSATRDIDGFYYFWVEQCHGAWSDYSLRLVANTLEFLNKPHEDKIKEYFNKS